jgi:hypothetical protein
MVDDRPSDVNREQRTFAVAVVRRPRRTPVEIRGRYAHISCGRRAEDGCPRAAGRKDEVDSARLPSIRKRRPA